MSTSATESFLSQLDKAASGTSYNLIEFEGLLESMKGGSVEVEEEIIEEPVEEIIEEIIVEEPE